MVLLRNLVQLSYRKNSERERERGFVFCQNKLDYYQGNTNWHLIPPLRLWAVSGVFDLSPPHSFSKPRANERAEGENTLTSNKSHA